MSWQVDKKVFDTKTQAEYEMARLQAEIEIRQMENERIQEAAFRKEIGLTLLENDADILYDKLVKAAVELAFVTEMGKNDYVVEQAQRKVVNTRTMYKSVCKKIFKICLKHGVKSEHKC